MKLTQLLEGKYGIDLKNDEEYEDLDWAINLLLKKVGTSVGGLKNEHIYINFPEDPTNTSDTYDMIKSEKFRKILASYDLVFDDTNFVSALEGGRSDFTVKVGPLEK
jgi:hypothetical protein